MDWPMRGSRKVWQLISHSLPTQVAAVVRLQRDLAAIQRHDCKVLPIEGLGALGVLRYRAHKKTCA